MRLPIRATQCAQVRHFVSVPDKGMRCLVPRQSRLTHNLTAVVECIREGATASKGAEVHHIAVVPKESVQGQGKVTAGADLEVEPSRLYKTAPTI